MASNLPHDPWHPDPPAQIHPWGQWATWAIKDAHHRIHEQQAELDRRAELIAAGAASKSTWGEWVAPMKPHAWKLALALAWATAIWIVTGELPDPLSIVKRLPGG